MVGQFISYDTRTGERYSRLNRRMLAEDSVKRIDLDGRADHLLRHQLKPERERFRITNEETD